jgi:hypothetical protein
MRQDQRSEMANRRGDWLQRADCSKWPRFVSAGAAPNLEKATPQPPSGAQGRISRAWMTKRLKAARRLDGLSEEVIR